METQAANSAYPSPTAWGRDKPCCGNAVLQSNAMILPTRACPRAGVSPTQSVFVYYGDYPNFTDRRNANSQSGTNMINLSDLRYDTTQVGGTFYDNHAGAVALAATCRSSAAPRWCSTRDGPGISA